MEQRSWNTLGDDFDEWVFDVVGNDDRGVLRRAIGRYGGGAASAAEYGCGVGRTLPILARRFETVYAIDFARSLLAAAQRRHAEYENVRYVRADLSRSTGGVKGVEFGLCVNALLSPDAEKRKGFLRTIRRSLVDGARLIVVVPSLECALFVNGRLVEWNRRSGLRGRSVNREAIAVGRRTARDLLDGVIDLAGLRTKHYLREEVLVALRDAGFRPRAVQKIEYRWDTYFERPPRWLGEPKPWDWLLVTERE